MKKYRVEYYRCTSCGLISTPEPHWLEEAYTSAIYAGDTGLVRRCRIQSHVTGALIRAERLSHGRYLDWAGGHGTLARMMRDRGFDYYTVDGYAENVLAIGFDGDENTSYHLVTAFEVVEHLVDPVH